MKNLFANALNALPHGPEFRFLDRLTALEPGKSGAGEYTLRGDEPWLGGHFPGAPLMPGVLLVEAAAQLAGVVAQSDSQIPPLAGLKLTALRNVKTIRIDDKTILDKPMTVVAAPEIKVPGTISGTGATIVIDSERAQHWLEHGALPTRTVAGLLRTQGIEAAGR